MYDTMKDRRIGIPEVIEKFGVPPDKVVDVQALAGDFVDNVPGVPGIGVKTAAQLINEYGDLETLLARPARSSSRSGASRLQTMPSRRASRASWCTLDDHVRSTCRWTSSWCTARRRADRLPEGDGIFHADPARREYSRRSGGCRPGRRPAGRAAGRRELLGWRRTQPSATYRALDRLRPRPPAPRRGEGACLRRPRQAGSILARRRRWPTRARPPRATQIDRRKYTTVRTLELLNWIARAKDLGMSPSTRPPRSIRCRPRSPASPGACAERGLLRAPDPQEGRRRRRAVRRWPRARPDQHRRCTRRAEVPSQ